MRTDIQAVRLLALSVFSTMTIVGGIVSPHAAIAATFYVATTGNNTNSCTTAQNQATPKRTIASGLACLAAAGDTLQIRGGTYGENIDSSQLISGTDWNAKAVTIQAFGSEIVTVTGQITVNSPGNGITKRYIIFKNLVVDGNSIAIGGGANGGAVDHIKLDGIEVKNLDDAAAIQIGGDDGTGDTNWVTNSKVHDGVYTGADLGSHGIYVQSSNNIIENSEIYNMTGFGIHNYAQGSNAPSKNIYRNLYIHNTGTWDGKISFAILLTTGSNNSAYNNLVINNQGGIRADTGNVVYNNTVYGSGLGHGGECCYEAMRITGATARNNIVFNNAINSIYNSSGTVSNNLTTDPKFVNSSSNDFHLQSTSPAIDKGTTLTAVPSDFSGIPRPQGAGYDIGAYEYQSTPLTLAAPANLRLVLP